MVFPNGFLRMLLIYVLISHLHQRGRPHGATGQLQKADLHCSPSEVSNQSNVFHPWLSSSSCEHINCSRSKPPKRCVNGSAIQTTRVSLDLALIDTGSVNREDYEGIVVVFFLIFNPICAVLGWIGNALSLRTLLHQKPRKAITVYLIGLCITDFLVITGSVLFSVQQIVSVYDISLGNHLTLALFSFHQLFIDISLKRISAFLTVILSIERTIATRFPLRVKQICLNRHPWKVVGSLYIVMLAFFLPNVFRFDTYISENEFTNRSMVVITPSAFANASQFYTYYGLVGQILTRILPMAVVFILNAITIITLRASERYRKQVVMYDLEEYKTTRLLLTISAIFLLCTTPGTVNGIVVKLLRNYGFNQQEHYLYNVIIDLSSSLVLLNSAVNFIVYMFLSSTFRKTFYDVWGCGKRQSKPVLQKQTKLATTYIISNGDM